ncbi:unnamed protein product [Caretta caretta]
MPSAMNLTIGPQSSKDGLATYFKQCIKDYDMIGIITFTIAIRISKIKVANTYKPMNTGGPSHPSPTAFQLSIYVGKYNSHHMM